MNNVELMRVPLKWGIAEKLIFADGVNPAWLGQGIKPEKRKGVLPLEVGRNAPKDGFFSEVYAAEIKPLITEQLRQAKIEEVGQALSGELASVESMIERGPKAGRPRAVIQDSTLRLLDLALQMPGNEVFNEAIRKLQLVAASLIESCKGETADAIVSRMEEVGALRERERMAERITPEKKRRKKGQGT
ncbi:MAG: hypothetical protein MUF81_04830 [Verrucomicrobia bacterium]|nr:hypothetical protein [Verrucomicrobiota bacterium]